MPFYKRSVSARRGRAAVPLSDLRDVCSLAALTLLRQLAELCGHSLALLGDIEGHVLALGHRAGRLHRRAARLQTLLMGEPCRLLLPRLLLRATSNLDVETKQATHAKLPWQQPVNVFLAAGRPPGMEQLHQEAQLNLQSMLQEEYEEQYSESRVTGQTFRSTGHPPPDTPTEPSPRPPPAKHLEFVLMPPSRRAADEESTSTSALGARPPNTCLSLPTSPDKQPTWPRAFPLPTLEEKQQHPSCSVQTNIIPINVSGQHFARHASARHSLFNTETAMNPKSTLRRRRTIIGFPNLSLRDQGDGAAVMGAELPWSPQEYPSHRAGSAPSWDKGGTCVLPHPGSSERRAWALRAAASLPDLGSNALLCSSWSQSVSPPWGSALVTMRPMPPWIEKTPATASPCAGEQGYESRGSRGNLPPGSRAEAEPAAGLARLEVERAGCRFRERSLSVPTDSGSLCSVDIAYAEARRGSANYTLGYPSASSEGSTSTDNVSLGLGLGMEQEGQRRQRSKSISLKKAKKKPSPPTRSVSLIKEGPDDVEPSLVLPRDQRPKSLCIPPEPQGHRLVHADPRGSAGREPEGTAAPLQWHLADWKAGADPPYRSLSSSSTATGTTAIECTKAQGSSESLMSPSISRATTPSQLSAEADPKTSSPSRPPGLMSPSSGYSSQSETPTPTVPASTVLGHSPRQVRVRPLVPERKSSLPPTSPMERSPKARLSFDLPLTPPAHLDLSGLKISLKGKKKVSRHHSDSTTFATKLAQKSSPITPIMPVVTQSDLRSVRLRSISRSEPEDNTDGPEHTEELPCAPCPGPNRKVKPPVAEKPLLAKRPPSILPKPPALREEGPLSPTSPPGTAGTATTKGLPQDGFVVLRKGELRRVSGEPPTAPVPAVGLRRLSHDSLEDEPWPPRRKAKVPPPVPKKPSVLYLPLVPAPVLGASMGDPAPTPSPIITLDADPTCCDPDAEDLPYPGIPGTSGSLWSPPTAGSPADPGTEEKSFASDKTAESIAEDDDEVFVTSRTTEDLFTVIHRSKRKVLGRKEPGDTFASRPNSHSPATTSGSPTSEAPAAVAVAAPGSTGKSSSRNEDFKALLQKKSSKTSAGTRPSAAELLKTTNPLARRVMTEFAPELDSASSPRSQP
uniref:NHS like 2 n=1 Tax=Amazona collaria TaxID=241587 RepID=A0A8B9GEC2_9PSIT